MCSLANFYLGDCLSLGDFLITTDIHKIYTCIWILYLNRELGCHISLLGGGCACMYTLNFVWWTSKIISHVWRQMAEFSNVYEITQLQPRILVLNLCVISCCNFMGIGQIASSAFFFWGSVLFLSLEDLWKV